MPTQLVLATVITLFVALCLQSAFQKWQIRQKERRWGCKPPNVYHHVLPWGIDNMYAWLKAAKAGRWNRRNIELFNYYGFTYESTLFGTRYINTRDTENLKTIAATKHLDYSKQTFQQKAIHPLTGPGLLRLEGAAWRKSRDLVTPLFKRAEVGDIGRLKRHVDKMMALIPRDGSTVDLAPLVSRLAVDNSTEFIFGTSANSLDDEAGPGQRFLDLWDEAVVTAGKRAHIGGGKLLFFQKLGEAKWLDQCTKVHNIVDGWISNRLGTADAKQATTSNDGVNPPPAKNYILIDEMGKALSDHAQIRHELLNIFGPARGGVGALLTNMFFYLARHPEIWRQLRQQALDLDLQGAPITFESLKSLTLFRHTAQEAIRLQGPSGQVQRLAVCDTILPRGGRPDGSFPVLVPKGTIVITNNFPIYHDPKIWGEDVEEFRPSRFEGKVLYWEFVPFLGGPRICPAQQHVYITAIYVLYRLVREFERIENRDPCWEYVEEVKMQVFSKNGALVALHLPVAEN